MSDHICIPEPVARAAEVRAHGGSWQKAAEEAMWSLGGLKTWIRNHEAIWARELGRARREARESACDEAVAVLRRQLRTDDARAMLTAADKLTARFAGSTEKKQEAPTTESPDETNWDEMESMVTALEPMLESPAPCISGADSAR